MRNKPRLILISLAWLLVGLLPTIYVVKFQKHKASPFCSEEYEGRSPEYVIADVALHPIMDKNYRPSQLSGYIYDFAYAKGVLFDRSLEFDSPRKVKVLKELREKLNDFTSSFTDAEVLRAEGPLPWARGEGDCFRDECFLEEIARSLPDYAMKSVHSVAFDTRHREFKKRLHNMQLSETLDKEALDSVYCKAYPKAKAEMLVAWAALSEIIQSLPEPVAEKILAHVEERVRLSNTLCYDDSRKKAP